MNIQKAMIQAQKLNNAIRGKKWPDGAYIYHGMDNLMRNADGSEFVWSVASLMATDYVITRTSKYHGPMAIKHV